MYPPASLCDGRNNDPFASFTIQYLLGVLVKCFVKYCLFFQPNRSHGEDLWDALDESIKNFVVIYSSV